MLALIQYNLATLAAALLIGIATGWWAFRGRRAAISTDQEKAEDSNRS